MSTLLDRVVGYDTDQGVRTALLELVVRTGHETIMADHLLAALLAVPGSSVARSLARRGWAAMELRDIIVANIPLPDRPGRAPARISRETLERGLRERLGDGEASLAVVLLECATREVREVLSIGCALEPLREAFDLQVDDAAPPPSFFRDDELPNRAHFTHNALLLLESVERTARDLGADTISLPHVFVGLAGQGILKSYLAGFTPHHVAALGEIARTLRKPARDRELSFKASNVSPSVQRYVECVQALAQARRLQVYDEVALVTALCQTKSQVLDGYWRALGADPRVVERMVAILVDESPIGGPPPLPSVDFDAVYHDLCGRVVGQAPAVRQVMPMVRKWKMGIRFGDRPAGVVLFMGPPGVGKTELSRELAELLYGDRKKLCFIEMNSMSAEYSISRLIGAPPGYVGSGDGQLTNWLAAQPESIVLFDEIERAHSKCFDVILRLLNEGRIQDGCGREYDATGSLILMTSNLGQEERLFDRLQPTLDRLAEDPSGALAEPRVGALIEQHFGAAFRSRLTRVVLFGRLQHQDYVAIARLAVERITAQLSRDLKRAVRVSNAEQVYTRLADEAERREQGARGVRSSAERIVDAVLTFITDQPQAASVSVGWDDRRQALVAGA